MGDEIQKFVDGRGGFCTTPDSGSGTGFVPNSTPGLRIFRCGIPTSVGVRTRRVTSHLETAGTPGPDGWPRISDGEHQWILNGRPTAQWARTNQPV